MYRWKVHTGTLMSWDKVDYGGFMGQRRKRGFLSIKTIKLSTALLFIYLYIFSLEKCMYILESVLLFLFWYMRYMSSADPSSQWVLIVI